MIVDNSRNMQRVCGETEAFYEGEPDNLLPAIYIQIFMHPGEVDQAIHTLTHEYVHYVWIMRYLTDLTWGDRMPANEVWTSTLAPSTCPAW